jgi:hypothetical protein
MVPLREPEPRMCRYCASQLGSPYIVGQALEIHVVAATKRPVLRVLGQFLVGLITTLPSEGPGPYAVVVNRGHEELWRVNFGSEAWAADEYAADLRRRVAEKGEAGLLADLGLTQD